MGGVRMKILIGTDTSLTFVCGGTSFVKGLATRLAAEGHEVLVMCPAKTLRGERITIDGISVCGIPSVPTFVQKGLRIVLPFGIDSYIADCVREFAPDIIHLQSHFAIAGGLWEIAKAADIAIVETNHVMPENFFSFFNFPKHIEARIARFGWWQLHRMLYKFDAVTTPTETAARFLRDSGFTKPVLPISNGIDLAGYRPGTGSPAIREKYLLPDKPLLLYVGRLDPEKHVEDLLEALSRIRAQVDAHLVIVGRGARKVALQERAAALGVFGQVTFTDYVAAEDLPELYRLASCSLMPGTAELQSIATLEAMASGLPVVAADAMALPELVHSGENGYLYPPRDTAVLAERIISVLTDDAARAAMGARSMEIVQAHDIAKTVAAYELVYRAAMAKHAVVHRYPAPFSGVEWRRLAIPTAVSGLAAACMIILSFIAVDYQKTDSIELSSHHFAAAVYSTLFVDSGAN